ncbi:efflux RND transporter periplasmic adaptor subunit [Paraferrimonas sp. SM1919]|uniref:efflux RND transporter periplasmic adaptor subunit n=1 Tax=Paraferrimonas sp. SM1919 TaxID=2662263 RepID=UPI0013D110AE|nr:efflux RND transporter periplasmic adaptor subunit [Paraferrimonas sp. SM1919]
MLQKAIKNPLICFYACLPLLLSACSDTIEVTEVQLPKVVKTMTVSSEDYMTKQFNGKIEASQSIDMSFRITGELIELPVKAGETVTKGQLIAKLDPRPQQTDLKAQEASLKTAKADYNRAQSLITSGAISQSELDSLNAKYISAKAAYEKSQQNLEYTELHAPFAGVVSKRYIDNFSKVSTSSKIVTLQNINPLKVIVDIPESILQSRGSRGDVTFTAKLPALKQEQPLTISEITMMEDGSQQYQIALSMIPPKNVRVWPGMSVKVNGRKLMETKNIILPSHSVLSENEGHYVYVINAHEDGSLMATKRTVTVNGVNKMGINISQGLSHGEQVIVAGSSQLFDGQKVRLSQ